MVRASACLHECVHSGRGIIQPACCRLLAFTGWDCAFLHPHQCNGDTWTKLVPMGNAEARWWLLRNKWHHCRAKIILFTYVRHFFVKIKCLQFSRNACIFTFHYTPRLRSHHCLKLNFISKIWNFTMQIITKSIIACQCVSRRHKKINIEVNKRILKNIGTH